MTEQGGGWPPPSSFDGYFATGPSPAAPPPLSPSLLPPPAALSPPIALPPPALARPPAPPSGSSSGSSSPRWLPALVSLALVAAIGVVALRARHHGESAPVGDGVLTVAAHHPAARDIIDPVRILDPPAPQPGQGGYTLLDERNGSPVAWDPCEPIHFVVRASGEIPGGRRLIDQAVAEVSKDTGLYFVDDGATDEAPSPTRSAYQPHRYGSTWAPVLIAWSSPAEYPDLTGDIVGLAGPIASSGGADEHLVTGEVVFDGPQLAQVESVPDGSVYAYDVVLHELGHLVGLGHVDDPNEVMNPVEVRALPGYGPGDLRGLAVAGSGRCFTKA